MTITKAHVYTTTGGQSFATHAEAKKAQNVHDRAKRLHALLGNEDAFTPADIAHRGDEILAALTLPSRRSPKAKSPTAS